ncbi:hypothetical protein E2562_026410, partial [Oryza meyeriana var. granulata]
NYWHNDYKVVPRKKSSHEESGSDYDPADDKSSQIEKSDEEDEILKKGHIPPRSQVKTTDVASDTASQFQVDNALEGVDAPRSPKKRRQMTIGKGLSKKLLKKTNKTGHGSDFTRPLNIGVQSASSQKFARATSSACLQQLQETLILQEESARRNDEEMRATVESQQEEIDGLKKLLQESNEARRKNEEEMESLRKKQAETDEILKRILSTQAF